jgi:hypothetical protein
MEIVCTQCRKPFVKAVRREGLLDCLLSLVYVYPFRCQICRHRFSVLRWGIRYNGTLDDRRRYVRHPVRLPVTLTSQSGKHDGRATDLSVGGCSIAVFAPYREGDVLSIWLQTPDDEPPIEVDAAVVRTVSQGRLGVEFVSLRDPEEARLRRLALTLWTESTLTARKRR